MSRIERHSWLASVVCAFGAFVGTADAQEQHAALLVNNSDYEISIALGIDDDSCESGFHDQAWYTLGPKQRSHVMIDDWVEWLNVGAIGGPTRFVPTESHSAATRCLSAVLGGKDCYWSVPYDRASDGQCSTILHLDRSNPFPDSFTYAVMQATCWRNNWTPWIEIAQTGEIPYLRAFCTDFAAPQVGPGPVQGPATSGPDPSND